LVLLTKTKRQLRTGVRLMNQVLVNLGLDKAKDKTFIGRIARGFDWLGYRLGGIDPQRVGIARQTWANHLDKLARLYEQAVSEEVVREYVRRLWV
jgi:hypothetical protein